ncbi:hypothetical protein [Halobellus sp. Atlit-38R]|uniref:hypothetical protein n=1 Tax=Halobellus sp. Atlit-38R TaxID=2282131 RepID=UPI0011C4542F|nr:hypothetical protein [Halobellus sp. Atlit-38R]
MNFLVYTAEPLDNNATLASFGQGIDKNLGRMINLIGDMDLDRVLENQTVSLLVDNVKYNKGSGIVTADIYKQTNPGKALHQLAEDDDGISVQKIISEHEDAFVQGLLGMKKVDSEVHILVENTFGSFFVAACKGMDITPHYSSKTIQSIQESKTIGKTTLDFAEDYDLTASLFKPPNDEDIREDEGFGNIDIANKITSLLDISRAHRMSLDINKDEWLNNVDVFDELIESGIVTKVRVEKTKDGVVKLGEGGDRAIREKVNTSRSGKQAIAEAFNNLPQ